MLLSTPDFKIVTQELEQTQSEFPLRIQVWSSPSFSHSTAVKVIRFLASFLGWEKHETNISVDIVLAD